MSKNFLDPKVREKLFQEKVVDIAIRRQKGTAMAIYGQLIENTPVDTSRAKSNWWMDENVSVTIREPDDGAAGAAQADTILKTKLKLDSTLYISNNLPYIQRLNDGWSKEQQPIPGWVEGAVQVGEARGKEYADRFK